MDVGGAAAPIVPATGHESPNETLDEILHDPWFRKDYEETKFHMEDFFLDLKESGGGDMDRMGEEEDGEEKRLNAFDLISLSPGFDLSVVVKFQQNLMPIPNLPLPPNIFHSVVSQYTLHLNFPDSV
ncbi:hypothetical protein Tsubulata_031752 [Turnera subulata]|uniref:NAF domain-containing protein n=1 Tax=Turnera subulata TaxID=218843 RepID=A0A9Q0FXG6_9ROSI|nr:hypothetical protein Tsubulata_031752 [Turnera subulata]